MANYYKSEINRIEFELEECLKLTTESDTHAIYLAHKVAFDEVMQLVKVYKPLLNQIKEEYESLINHMNKAEMYTKSVQSEIETAISYPTTLENYSRQCLLLRQQLNEHRRLNEDQLEKLRDLRMKSAAVEKYLAYDDTEEKHKAEHSAQRKMLRREMRILPNCKLEDLTDLTTMQTLCNELTIQKQQIDTTKSTKYLQKEQQQEVIEQLSRVVHQEQTVRMEVTNLLRRKILLKSALSQAEAYQMSHAPHQDISEVMSRALVTTAQLLDNNNNSHQDQSEIEIDSFYPTVTSESTNQSDYIVLCIEKFQKLIQQKMYKEAADLAVVVPREVLRNYSTLTQFKEVGDIHLLYYSMNLIRTMKPREILGPEMSFECVDVALKLNRWDLINLWLTNNRITKSELIASNIVSYCDLMTDNRIIGLELAIDIYKHLLYSTNDLPEKLQKKYFDSIVECLLKSGKIDECLYTISKSPNPYGSDDYAELIQFYPYWSMVERLLTNNLIDWSVAITNAIQLDNFMLIVQLIKYRLSLDKSISATVDHLVKIEVISSDVWEGLLNFIDDTNDEKLILELASSYLVQVALNRSYMVLQTNGLFDN